MTLDNLISLVQGQLLNEVTISSFNAVTDKASRVQRGDLFVCVDQSESSVDEALRNGAYGIVFDKITPKLDDETAWIHVDNCFESHLKLLRFHLMPKNIEVFYADIYTIEYISLLQLGLECKVISDDIADIVNKLWHLQEPQKLILKKQDELLTLFPTAQEICQGGEYDLVARSIYESDLLKDGLSYKRLRIPKVLHHSFKQALQFLQSFNIPYKIEGLTFPKSFQLISCDNALHVKEFGKGNKTLLFINEDAIAKQIIADVASLSPWIRVSLYLNKNLNNLSYNQCILFSDAENLCFQLQSEKFDLAIIMGESSHILDDFPKPTQTNLFQLEF